MSYNVVGWGVNGSNQLGTATSPVLAPTMIDQAARNVSAGYGTSYVTYLDGSGQAVGSNSLGALGASSTASGVSSFTPMTTSKTVMSVVAGMRGGEVLLQ